MAKKSGLTPLWAKRDIRKIFDKLGERTETVCINLLARTGEEFVKIARLQGNYIDQTGNLRSSIGYIILKDGVIRQRDFRHSDKEGSDKETGVREGEQLAVSLVSDYPNGSVLICVAGMKYAAFVEAMENKDVMTLAANKAEGFVLSQSRMLFDRLSEM